jgi:hypothetical protein
MSLFILYIYAKKCQHFVEYSGRINKLAGFIPYRMAYLWENNGCKRMQEVVE